MEEDPRGKAVPLIKRIKKKKKKVSIIKRSRGQKKRENVSLSMFYVLGAAEHQGPHIHKGGEPRSVTTPGISIKENESVQSSLKPQSG